MDYRLVTPLRVGFSTGRKRTRALTRTIGVASGDRSRKAASMHARRHLATLALLTSLVLSALAGCSDDAEPKAPDPTPTPSSTKPTTPTATPSIDDPETPEQVVRTWVEAQNEMQTTGDSTAYSDLSAGRCGACTRLIRRVEAIYAAGGWIRTDGWRIRSVVRLVQSEERAEFEVRVVSAATRYVESKGARPIGLEGGRTEHHFYLEPDRGAWKVTRVDEISQG